MPINPLNVIQLFLVAFQTMNIPDSEVNDAERQLADHFVTSLLSPLLPDASVSQGSVGVGE